jgi:hypothetical protein
MQSITIPQNAQDMVSYLSNHRGRLPPQKQSKIENLLLKKILQKTPVLNLGHITSHSLIPPPYNGELDIDASLSGSYPRSIPAKMPVIHHKSKSQPHLFLCLDESLSVSTESKLLQYYITSTLIKSYKNLTIIGYSTNTRIIGYRGQSENMMYKKLFHSPEPEYTNIGSALQLIYKNRTCKQALFICEGSHNIGPPPQKMVQKQVPIHIIDIQKDNQLQYICNYSKGYYYPLSSIQMSHFSQLNNVLQRIFL